MKNLIAALLISAVASNTCEWQNLSFKIYSDGNCKHLNKWQTKNQGHVREDTAYLFEGGVCHQVKNPDGKPLPLWIRMQCNSHGFHEGVFKDAGCHTPYVDEYIGEASFSLPWDKCKSMYGQGFIAHTSQKF